MTVGDGPVGWKAHIPDGNDPDKETWVSGSELDCKEGDPDCKITDDP